MGVLAVVGQVHGKTAPTRPASSRPTTVDSAEWRYYAKQRVIAECFTGPATPAETSERVTRALTEGTGTDIEDDLLLVRAEAAMALQRPDEAKAILARLRTDTKATRIETRFMFQRRVRPEDQPLVDHLKAHYVQLPDLTCDHASLMLADIQGHLGDPAGALGVLKALDERYPDGDRVADDTAQLARLCQKGWLHQPLQGTSDSDRYAIEFRRPHMLGLVREMGLYARGPLKSDAEVVRVARRILTLYEVMLTDSELVQYGKAGLSAAEAANAKLANEDMRLFSDAVATGEQAVRERPKGPPQILYAPATGSSRTPE